jgi:hypothetical protein
MSHPIRGTTGDIEGNCKKAAAAARRLRHVFPEVDFYVPAEHDLTLQILTAEHKLSIDDILFADLQILTACSGYMFYHFQESAGSTLEWQKAQDLELGHCFDTVNYSIEKASYSLLRKDFTGLVETAIQRFREKRRKMIAYVIKNKDGKFFDGGHWGSLQECLLFKDKKQVKREAEGVFSFALRDTEFVITQVEIGRLTNV